MAGGVKSKNSYGVRSDIVRGWRPEKNPPEFMSEEFSDVLLKLSLKANEGLLKPVTLVEKFTVVPAATEAEGVIVPSVIYELDRNLLCDAGDIA